MYLKDLPLQYFNHETKQFQMNFFDNFASNIINFIEKYYSNQNVIIWNAFIQSNTIQKSYLIVDDFVQEVSDLTQNHNHFLQAFKNSPNNRIRNTVLSLIASKFQNKSLKIAFNVTDWQIRMGREHSAKYGAGAYLEKRTIFRHRLDTGKVKIFLEFICQSNYLQDVAYGHRMLKINDDISIAIPDSIRLAFHKTIITDYLDMCLEENLMPLGQTTCYKILKACPASFSKSLQGLDNILADGLEAFKSIKSILNTLKTCNIDSNKINTLLSMLDSSKVYLEQGYKKHIDFYSECTDHCANFALTHEKEKQTEILCEHSHKRNCQDCNTLDFVLAQVFENVERFVLDVRMKNELFYQLDLDKKKVYDWKHHIIRTWVQDQIKYKILNEINAETCYLHQDWAMKFEPQKALEPQSEWFGKKGKLYRHTPFYLPL